MTSHIHASTSSGSDVASAAPSGREFRNCMGMFPTGVAIATTVAGDSPVAVTVNSLTSVSLAPPMVLFCLDRTSRSLDAFRQSGFFALSILSLDQRNLSTRFATGGKRWDDIPTDTWVSGAPILTGALAAMDCRLDVIHSGGDHEILLGVVEECRVLNAGSPLLYHVGQYAELPS